MQVKTRPFILFLIIVFSLAINPVIGKAKAPDFELISIYGEQFKLSTYIGKVVVIDFFGTQCSPCISEIEHLKSLYNRYPQDQFVIISIDVVPVGTNDDYLRSFAQQYGMEWTVARDTDQVSDRYGVSLIPTLFIVDTEGYYHNPYIGLTPASELISEIDSFYVTILSPKNKQYTTSSVPLNFTINKAASWTCYSLDGHENVTINGNTNLTNLEDGSHYVVVYFKEESGNTVYSNKVSFSIGIATQQIGPPYTLIFIIVGAVIVSILVGIVVAGRLRGWSEPSKKRHRHSHSR